MFCKNSIYKRKNMSSIMFSPNPWRQDSIWVTTNAANNPQGCMTFKSCENLCFFNVTPIKGKCLAFNYYDPGTCSAGTGVCEFLFQSDIDGNIVDSFPVLGVNASSYVIGPKQITYASSKSDDNTLTSLTKFKNATLGLSIAVFVVFGLIIRNIF
jgi:hypothetical protein